MTPPTSSSARQGFAAGLGAYLLWGFLPLYFPLLEPATPLDISAHRVIWSWVICMILLVATRGLREFTALVKNRQKVLRLSLAAVLLSANWLIFLIGVLSGRVVEAALGYFMNPIVTVLLAVAVLRESINRMQVVGLTAAGLGLTVLIVETGTVPWISISLALTFGIYGLIKKQVAGDVPALAGFAVETTALLPVALIYLGVITYLGTSTFGVAGGPFLAARWEHVALLMFSGVATTVPLLLFAGATRRIPLTTIGMIQFMTPILQFVTGVYIYGEAMSVGRWVGFVGVWVALIIMTLDAARKARTNRRLQSHPRVSRDADGVSEGDAGVITGE